MKVVSLFDECLARHILKLGVTMIDLFWGLHIQYKSPCFKKSVSVGFRANKVCPISQEKSHCDDQDRSTPGKLN